jgi:hypothetical protein
MLSVRPQTKEEVMDNEADAISRGKKRILVVDDGVSELAGLIALFGDVYDVRSHYSPFPNIKKASQPPSKKPVECRDEYDLQRLRKAEQKRLRRAAKFLRRK